MCAVAFLYLPVVFAGKRTHSKTPLLLRDVSCSEESASGRIVPPRVFALERTNAFGVCGTGANDILWNPREAPTCLRTWCRSEEAFPADNRPGGGAALGSIDSAGGGGREDILVRSVACWVLISSVLLPVCTGFTGSVSWVGRT